MQELFGKYKDQKVYLYTIENEYLQVKVSSLGATMVSFIDKKLNRDIVLGFKDADGYINQHGSYLGATVGRCANRIGKGEFTIDGVTYHVPVNAGPNCLHGGNDNLSYKVYDAEVSDDRVVMHTFSEDNEEGFPGNLSLTITYRLDGKNLYYIYEAECDKNSIVNITNHSYFNIDGSASKTILNQELKVFTDKVALVDENGLATREVIKVTGTGFDFSDYNNIGTNMQIGHKNIESANGYDHNFVYENMNDKIMASIRTSDLMMNIYSDLPGMHIYTANFLDGMCEGKEGNFYGKNNGICFECQFYPNSINYDEFIKPLIMKGEAVKHYIRYELED